MRKFLYEYSLPYAYIIYISYFVRNQVYIYNIANNKHRFLYTSHSNIKDIVIDKDLIVLVGYNNIFVLKNGKMICYHNSFFNVPITNVVISTDKNYIICSYENQGLFFFQLRNNKIETVKKQKLGYLIRELSLSPNGDYLAIFGSKKMEILDLRTFSRVSTYKGFNGGTGAFTKDWQLASMSLRDGVAIFDQSYLFDEQKMKKKLQQFGELFFGSKGYWPVNIAEMVGK